MRIILSFPLPHRIYDLIGRSKETSRWEERNAKVIVSLSLSLGRAELASKMKETHATRTEHDIVRFQDRIIELRVASWEARRGEATRTNVGGEKETVVNRVCTLHFR